jgi:hypothetical protein
MFSPERVVEVRRDRLPRFKSNCGDFLERSPQSVRSVKSVVAYPQSRALSLRPLFSTLSDTDGDESVEKPVGLRIGDH